jgi:hypothetical protein
VPVGEEFLVNIETVGIQDSPAIAADSAGNFIVVWENVAQPPFTDVSIRARRFESSGATIGTEFQINSESVRRFAGPDVAMAADGSFVVVWKDNRDGYDERIRSQFFDSDAMPTGSSFYVDSESYYHDNYYGNYRGAPAAASDPAGGFVVVWSGGYRYQSTYPRLYYSIIARRLDAIGMPADDEFHAGGGDYWSGGADVAVNAAGEFVVVWTESYYEYEYYDHRKWRRNEAKGCVRDKTRAVSGGCFDVSDDDSAAPAVAPTDDGDGNSDGSSTGVFATTFLSDGTPLGSPVAVNAFAPNAQFDPAIASLGGNETVVAWASEGQDGDDRGIVACRFTSVVPACGDPTADGQTSASDALRALQAAISVDPCAPCICDVDRSERVSALDALLILKIAMGEQIPPACGSC